jgi:hypothetical protein
MTGRTPHAWSQFADEPTDGRELGADRIILGHQASRDLLQPLRGAHALSQLTPTRSTTRLSMNASSAVRTPRGVAQGMASRTSRLSDGFRRAAVPCPAEGTHKRDRQGTGHNGRESGVVLGGW